MGEESHCIEVCDHNEDPVNPAESEEPSNNELAPGQEPMQADTLAQPGEEEEDDDFDAPVASATRSSEAAPADNSDGAEDATASAGVEEEPVLVVDADPGDEEPAPSEHTAPVAAGADEPEPSEGSPARVACEKETEPSEGSPARAACDKETEPSEASPARVACDNETERSNKRATRGGAQEQLAKRPRWGDKAFQDITMGDIEVLVRKCNSLEEKVEAQTDQLQEFQELKSEKKDLEKQLQEVTPEMVTRAKSALAKQFLSQMVYTSNWNTELKKSSRPLAAFLPNVSLELLKALGGDRDITQRKRSTWYFENPLFKTVPMPVAKSAEKPAGSALILGPWVTLKYIKTHEELQASATYMFGLPATDQEKSTTKGRGRGRGKGKGRGKGRGKAEEAEDQPGELSDGNVSDAAVEIKQEPEDPA